MNFKYFLENQKNNEDVSDTIKKLPKSHQKLVKGYKFVFEPNNTLKNDKKHIGYIDEEEKTIKIASPWNYGREYTLLHEIAHIIWKYILDNENKKEWKKLCKDKKHLEENYEEIFCMIYAQLYAENKIKKFDHQKLLDFVKSI